MRAKANGAERVVPCKPEAVPERRDGRAAKVRPELSFRACAAEALRLPVAPGDEVRLVLTASWTGKDGKPRLHVALDGTFAVPDQPDGFGAPGYSLHVPSLETLAYLTTARVMLADGTDRQELVGFDIVLFF